ncbi:MAG: hypothetical protein P4L53_12515 [Candidatus Obscuribacterales bacterium]|nr:hypothetical protein [Candidatus Obscuribacterales bacterium]
MFDIKNHLQRNIVGAGVRGRVDYSTQKLKIAVRTQDKTEYVMGAPQNITTAKPLLSTLPLENLGNDLISGASLSLKSKIFDDGLYAAVELLVDAGSPTFMGKTDFVRQLVSRVLEQTTDRSASGLSLLSALELLRTDSTQAQGDLCLTALQISRSFLDNVERSKPIGFYTWSEDLSRIFRRDRLSQQKLFDQDWMPVIDVLRQNEALNKAYLQHLLVPSRLTNPLTDAGMALAVSSPEWRCQGVQINLFPASTSLEKRVQDLLPLDAPGPLIDEIIARLRSNEISIVPDQNSGWYDHQLYALSALILFEQLPESKKLSIDEKYRECLDELFKGFYALTREIHIKQLEMSWGSGRPLPTPTLYVRPTLTVEPLPTYYDRKSLAYKFINQTLQEMFGVESLQKIHRQTAHGAVEKPLFDELVWIEMLFRGAAATACIELGMDPATIIEGDYSADYDHFIDYAKQISNDSELASDCRMMVPVQVDGPDSYTIWAFLGWEDVLLDVSYLERPIVLGTEYDTDSQGYKNFQTMYRGSLPETKVEYSEAAYKIYRPVCAELKVKSILNRQEFQAVCNEYKSAEAIIAKLKV